MTTIAAILAILKLLVLLTTGTPAQDMDWTQGLPPCQEEDSDNCYWDAGDRGNGLGHSFIVQDGIYTYQN